MSSLVLRKNHDKDQHTMPPQGGGWAVLVLALGSVLTLAWIGVLLWMASIVLGWALS
jgi:hypothetical protein